MFVDFGVVFASFFFLLLFVLALSVVTVLIALADAVYFLDGGFAGVVLQLSAPTNFKGCRGIFLSGLAF